MTPEAINIAIAEHLGAKLVQSLQTKDVFLTFEPQKFSHPSYWRHLDSWPLDQVYLELGIPNYCGDLNAMQQAVLSQRFSTKMQFAKELSKIASRGAAGQIVADIWMVFQPCASWAEAFVRAVGKWKEAA